MQYRTHFNLKVITLFTQTPFFHRLYATTIIHLQIYSFIFNYWIYIDWNCITVIIEFFYFHFSRFPDRPFQALRKDHEALVASTSGSGAAGTASPIVSTALHQDPDFNGSLMEESSSLGAAGGDTSDSKDSQQQPQQQQQQQLQLKEDLPKEWFYDEIDINDNDSLEEPKSPADDEFDYDPRYGNKKRRKRGRGKRALLTPGEGEVRPGPGRRRSGAGRGRSASSVTTASFPDTSLSGLDSIDGMGTPTDVTATPTTSTTTGRRPRGSGTRGRRRAKNSTTGNCNPPSPGVNSEPPSFESAAAAVGVIDNLPPVVEDHSADLRNYRKYL